MKKIKILIADDEEVLRDILEMILESEINAEFIKVENGELAEVALKENPDIDLIISDYTMPVKNGGSLFLANKNLNNLPFILASGGFSTSYPEFKNFKSQNSLNEEISKPYSDNQLIESVKKIIKSINSHSEDNSSVNITPPQFNKEKVELIRIKLSQYMKYTLDANDAYIMLHQNKFVKIKDETPGVDEDKEILCHYLNKKIEYIYITREAFTKLILEYKANLVNFANPEDRIELAGQVFHISLECLNSMGMSSDQIKLVNGLVEDTIKEILIYHDIALKFKQITEDQGYIVGHSLLLVYVAAAILKKSNLNFNNSMKKICMAAFVHDASLKNDDFARLELKLEMCETRAEKESILNHSNESAKLLESANELIEETKKIVIEHHETPDGTGYPKGIDGTKIFHLSALFILAHDIAIELIKNDYSSNCIQPYLLNRKNYYTIGNFNKFYQLALEGLN